MIALLARFVPSLLPGLGAIANPWVLLVISAIAAGVWFHGYAKGRDRLDQYIAAQAVAATKIVARQGEVTAKVIAKHIKVAGETRVITETIEREVIRYADANPAGVCLDARWGVLHDAAALNTVPDPARLADGAGTAPAAAQALGAVTQNYARHHACADRLDALQEWVREQGRVR